MQGLALELMLPQALQLVMGGQVMAQKSRRLQSRQQFTGRLLALALARGLGLGLRLVLGRAGLGCLQLTAVKAVRVT